MPIEIRELNIKVSVSQPQQEQGTSPDPAGTQTGLPEKEELIAEVVEQVMELIKLQKER
jgi:hypothetical protein